MVRFGDSDRLSGVFRGGRQCTVVQADTYGPEPADLLEMQRTMALIGSQQCVVAVRERSNLRW